MVGALWMCDPLTSKMCKRKWHIHVRRRAFLHEVRDFYWFLFVFFSFLEQALVFSRQPQVRIQCLSGSMVVTIKDAPSSVEGQFSGIVYPKDLSKNSTCLAEFHDHPGMIKYKLPLRSCSTMPQENENGEIEFFNTIVVQPHLKLVTDLTTSYHVRCKYKSREAAMKASPGNPQAYTSDVVEEGKDRSNYGRSLENR